MKDEHGISDAASALGLFLLLSQDSAAKAALNLAILVARFKASEFIEPRAQL